MTGPLPAATALRHLPAVDQVLKTPPALLAIDRFGRTAATEAVRSALEAARTALRAGHPARWMHKTSRLAPWPRLRRPPAPRCGRCSTSRARCCTPISAAPSWRKSHRGRHRGDALGRGP